MKNRKYDIPDGVLQTGNAYIWVFRLDSDAISKFGSSNSVRLTKMVTSKSDETGSENSKIAASILASQLLHKIAAKFQRHIACDLSLRSHNFVLQSIYYRLQPVSSSIRPGSMSTQVKTLSAAAAAAIHCINSPDENPLSARRRACVRAFRYYHNQWNVRFLLNPINCWP